MLCAHARDCTITQGNRLLSHAAAVDRQALPGAHRTTPFAANFSNNIILDVDNDLQCTIHQVLVYLGTGDSDYNIFV